MPSPLAVVRSRVTVVVTALVAISDAVLADVTALLQPVSGA